MMLVYMSLSWGNKEVDVMVGFLCGYMKSGDFSTTICGVV